MNPEVMGVRPDHPLNKVHPLMIVGIFLFIAPFLSNAMKVKLPGWISGIGVAVILIGVVLTIMGETR